MNKAELINSMAKESGLTKTDTKKALDAFIKSTSEALSSGERVALVGFGSWVVKERSARKGRNPQTKAVIDIPAKKVVKFKSGSDLSQSVL